ncbi:hypothetical protein SM124_01485 [Bacillus sp. 31A1R]|uniref:Uncharacterized protein n=1 Tax=Robertmurraya mangrovi TaxID=3098077 RepID=A0ABU5ITC2_9BACI|nr:hypothetical protein [Bacillus sp. 31A1R]MDZ5470409.1 hypothetical protein [Bacillus sp. 31A1R]
MRKFFFLLLISMLLFGISPKLNAFAESVNDLPTLTLSEPTPIYKYPWSTKEDTIMRAQKVKVTQQMYKIFIKKDKKIYEKWLKFHTSELPLKVEDWMLQIPTKKPYFSSPQDKKADGYIKPGNVLSSYQWNQIITDRGYRWIGFESNKELVAFKTYQKGITLKFNLYLSHSATQEFIKFQEKPVKLFDSVLTDIITNKYIREALASSIIDIIIEALDSNSSYTRDKDLGYGIVIPIRVHLYPMKPIVYVEGYESR